MLLLVGGPLSWIDDREGRRDHQNLAQAPFVVCRNQHSPETGVERDASQALTDVREPSTGSDLPAGHGFELDTVYASGKAVVVATIVLTLLAWAAGYALR